MAVIQKLRNSGVVVGVVVAALVLFVVSDILSSKYGNGNPNQSQDIIATIYGEEIKDDQIDKIANDLFMQKLQNDPNLQEKMQKDDELRRKTIKEVYGEAWDELIKKQVLYSEIEKANITLSDADVEELLWGEYHSQTMEQIPDFKTNGKFDAAIVKRFYKQAKTNSMLRGFLLTLTNSIKDQELMSRYATYVAKANVKTKVEKEMEYLVANQTVSGSIVAVAHNSVPDKDIKVTDAELEAYLEEHKEEYKNLDERRTVKYVVWDVTPTSQDTQNIYEQAVKYAEGLRATTEADTSSAGEFLNIADVGEKTPQEVGSQLWRSPEGSVLGPLYKAGKFYVYQKVKEKKDTGLTVRASHILIPNDGPLPDGTTTITDSVMALAKATELFNQVKGGANIAELASKFSTDQGSATNGGDLGWKGVNGFVKPFADFCKTAVKGQVGLVKTQFGYHIIKMMEEPSNILVKYSENIIPITPGNETVKRVSKASREFKSIIGSDAVKFDKTQEQQGLVPRLVRDIQTNTDRFAGIEEPSDVKEVLYWLFDNNRKSGDVSDVFSFPSRHVVMKVEAAKHVGYATLEDVRSEIEPLVRQELKGKKIAEKLESAIAKAKNPNDLSKAVNGLLIPADDLRMGQRMIPQLNAELKILGAVFGSQENKFSKPVIGKEYTAVVYITKRKAIEVPKSVLTAPDQYAFMNSGQFMAGTLDRAFKKQAKIQDYRYKFEWF